MIIASHISPSKLKEWSPKKAWPDGCTVQWGGSGIVLGRKSYRTAFFEAFPRDGSAGFIRGEGSDLDAAETNAFEKWSRMNACNLAGGHLWSRTRRLKDGGTRTYSNGGCFCLRCGSFEGEVMPPIVELGSWRRPLSVSELDCIASGILALDRKRRDERFNRRLVLKARVAGIQLPECTGDDDASIETYEAAARRAVAEHVARICLGGRNLDRAKDGIGGLFDGFGYMSLLHDAVEFGFLPASVLDHEKISSPL